MKIGGVVPFSLCDYPGRMSVVVFTQGCNFRCPFCHNGSLIPADAPAESLPSELSVLEFLDRRRRQLDGVVVSGGEPTIQPDLLQFLRHIKRLGFLVKLDTNGSRPDVLSSVTEGGVVDFIAMDVKSPIEEYFDAVGVDIPADVLRESIGLIAKSCISHEFRTTLVPGLVSDDAIRRIRGVLPGGSPHRLQEFRKG
ncbi:MAG: anaerobic ribonucleoside-triphosphate reductase activating protein [Bacteroidota bacterium]